MPPSLDSVLPMIRAEVARGEIPVIVVEPSDNIGGGAPGDLTQVFRALAASGIGNSAVVINDPIAVAEVNSRPVGWRGSLTFGGRSDPRFDSPVTCEVELVSTSDGQFTLEDRHSHLASMCGVQIDMGPCAVVQHAGIRVLLTSRKTPPFDLGQLRSQGIIPETLSVIGVKAAVAHRQAYDPIAKHSHTVNTLGPCTSDLRLAAVRTNPPANLFARPFVERGGYVHRIASIGWPKSISNRLRPGTSRRLASRPS